VGSQRAYQSDRSPNTHCGAVRITRLHQIRYALHFLSKPLHAGNLRAFDAP
jgi:hypothetical protein